MDYESRDSSPRKKRHKYYAREWEEVDRAYQSPYEAGDYLYQDEFTQRMIAEDRYEASQMGMPDPHPYASVSQKVQRKPESPFQEQDMDAFRHSLAYGDEWGIPPESQAIMREVLAKSGEPLGKENQEFFETRMGEDFSDVRIHTDADAAKSAESINAKAYTTGNDIVFGDGEYQPDTKEGQRLMAHELAHVVQQRDGVEQVQRAPNDGANPRIPPQQRPRIASAQVDGGELLIVTDYMAPGSWKAEDVWYYLENDLIRLEKDGLRSKYAERFPVAPDYVRASPESDTLFSDWVYSNSELGTIAFIRFHTPDEMRIIIRLRAEFDDGSKLVYKNKVVDAGAFESPGESSLEVAESDYATVTQEILKALSGPTFYSDSERIIEYFRTADAGAIRTILHRLKQQGSNYRKTPAEMIEWLFYDLSADHREELKDLLIKFAVVDDLVPQVARDLLENEDADEVFEWVTRFHGRALDLLLLEIQTRGRRSWTETALWIFETAETLQREKIREHFLNGNSDTAREYGIWWTTYRINQLLEDYTSMLDSGSIVWNFRQLPTEKMRMQVFDSLETRGRDSIGDFLMDSLQRDDYATLQELGLPLSDNTSQADLTDMVREELEWNEISAEVIAGGLVGLVTGAVELIWEIFKGVIVGTPILIYDFFMVMLFMFSRGAVGSDSVLKLAETLEAISTFAGSPFLAIQQAYDDTLRESDALEGSAEAFRRAEFWSSFVIKFILTIAAIAAGRVTLRKSKDSSLSPHLKSVQAQRRRLDEDAVPEMEMLFETGDKLLKDYEKFLAATGKKTGRRQLTEKQKKKLIARGRKRLEIKDWLDVEYLWDLAAKTGVEWAMQDLNGKIYLTAGWSNRVPVWINGTVTRCVHTHFVSYQASSADYKIWKKLKDADAPITRIEIILKGEPFYYDDIRFDMLKAAGKLTDEEAEHPEKQ